MKKLLSLCLCALLLLALASCTEGEPTENPEESQLPEEQSLSEEATEKASYDIDARSVYSEEESDDDGYAKPRSSTSRSAGSRSKEGMREEGGGPVIGYDPGAPAGVAALTLDALRVWDTTTLDRYVKVSSYYYGFEEYMTPESSGFMKKYLRRMTYQVLEERIDGDSAEVDLSITAPSAEEFLTVVLEDLRRQIAAGTFTFDYYYDYDESKIFDYLEGQIKDSLSLKTSRVTVYLDREEESADWRIDVSGYKNDPFLSAAFGGMEEAFYTVGDELFELLWYYY